VGQAVTLTASVSPAAATGTVTFNQGQNTLGTATVTSGQAALTISNLPAGSLSLTAVYSGDTQYAGSTSAKLTQTVNKGASSTTISSSPNPSNVGQAVTFTGNVTVSPSYGGSANGTVSFVVGSTTLGTRSLVATGNATATATFSTSTLSKGKYNVKAVYGGSAAYVGSTSTAITQVVQ
jgi:hypothetical protein